MTEISQDLAQRMAALVRGMAEHEPFIMPAQHGKATSDDYARAKIIAAELPAPVDSDLVEARKMAAGMYPVHASSIMAGQWDGVDDITLRLAGIKRGRALYQGEG